MSPSDDNARDCRERFERDGYVVQRGVLDRTTVAAMSAHVDWLGARHPKRRGEDLGHDLLADDPFWLGIVADDRLIDVAAIFVGPDLALFASHYICKPPHAGRPVLWHQDAAFWPLEPMRVVTVWIAVDPATPENGCLRVIPGSHREGRHSLRRRDDVDSVLGAEAIVDVDEARAVDVVLAPGDVEIHHPDLLHASGANHSDRRRCGLTIRYIPTSTQIVGEPQPYPSAFHLRGAPGRNSYQPWPTFDARRHFALTSSVAPVRRG